MRGITRAALVAFSLLVAAAAASAQAPVVPAPKLGGYVQARETIQERAGASASLNRARFSIDGSLPSRFTYRMLVETEASAGRNAAASVSLREATIRWAPGAFSVTAGQYKTPFSREYLVPVPALETPDFAAVVDSLSPKYDVGASMEYAFGPFATATLGAFNGEGQNAVVNRDSVAMIVARLVARPLAPVTLGGSVARDGSDSLRWGVETVLEQWGGSVRGEYITRHRRGRARDRDDRGWYVLDLFRVVPQAQLVVRQEEFERPAIGVSRRVRATTVGAIVEVVPNRVRLLVDGVHRLTGARTRTHAAIAQLQVRF